VFSANDLHVAELKVLEIADLREDRFANERCLALPRSLRKFSDATIELFGKENGDHWNLVTDT
jgi:hypothetical protein